MSSHSSAAGSPFDVENATQEVIASEPTIEAILTAVRSIVDGRADLASALESLHLTADDAAISTAELRVLVELLRLCRSHVGSMPLSHWRATFHASGAIELGDVQTVDLLLLLAAHAGGVTLPELALLRQPRFATHLLQLAVVIVVLVTEAADLELAALLTDLARQLAPHPTA